MLKYVYKAITVKVLGADSGIFSYLTSKSIDEPSIKQLNQLGGEGWELVGVMPVTFGAGFSGSSSQGTPAGICFLRKPIMTCNDLPPIREIEGAPNHEAISGERMKELLHVKLLRARFVSIPSSIDPSDWRDICRYQIIEALPFVEKHICESFSSLQRDPTNSDEIKTFYEAIDSELATESLYRIAADPKVFDYAFQNVKELGLFSFDRIAAMLKSDKLQERVNAVKFLFVTKPKYEYEDFAAYESLKQIIKQQFPLSKLYERPKAVFSGRRSVWQCVNCSAESEDAASWCTCGFDRHGLRRDFNDGYNGVLSHISSIQEIISETLMPE